MRTRQPARSLARRRAEARRAPTETDYRALLRLAGEAAELPAFSRERRDHIMRGLLSLIGGVGTAGFEMSPDTPSGLPSTAPLETTGFDDPVADTVFTRYTQQGLWQTDPAPLEMLRRQVFVGQARTWVEDGLWEASLQYQQMRRPLGVDNQIYCRFANGHQHWGIGLHRAHGDRPFSARDLKLVEEFFTLNPSALLGPRHLAAPAVPAAAPLASGAPPAPPLLVDPDVAALPPRLRALLEALLAGQVPKEIARREGKSLHTVYEYQKQLYRALNVSGRSELFARFLGRSLR